MKTKLLVAAATISALAVGVIAQAQTIPSGPITFNPTQFPYQDSLDSAKAAPGQHRLLYEDDHLRLLEVTYRPHERGDALHGHPFSSVFAMPSLRPPGREVRLNDLPPAPRTRGEPPPGMQYPACQTMTPQAPHRPENLGDFPDHFYRVEFKRIDGEGFKDHWAEWYPYLKKRMLVDDWIRISGKRPFGQAKVTHTKLSPDKISLNPKGYPYPDSTDSVSAAPGQHWLRFENDTIRFVEVMYRPGEEGDAMHGHAYPSVFAMDTPLGKFEDAHVQKDLSSERQGHAGGPPGMDWPQCATMAPQSPHRPHNLDTVPLHFYRIEFKRLDGEGIKDHWREWYPWMVKK